MHVKLYFPKSTWGILTLSKKSFSVYKPTQTDGISKSFMISLNEKQYLYVSASKKFNKER